MKRYYKNKNVDFDYRKPVVKFFRKHEKVREEFEDSIMKILNREHAEQVNVKPLHGKFRDYSRIAIGSYRIIYQIINGEIIVVSVEYAGSRGDVYKKFQG